MSEEQKKSSSFMQELDKWTEMNIILPLGDASQRNEEAWEETAVMVKKAIREKVLQSYRNGRMTRGAAMRRKICRRLGAIQCQCGKELELERAASFVAALSSFCSPGGGDCARHLPLIQAEFFARSHPRPAQRDGNR